MVVTPEAPVRLQAGHAAAPAGICAPHAEQKAMASPFGPGFRQVDRLELCHLLWWRTLPETNHKRQTKSAV